MAEVETWTVGKLLSWTTDFLRKHGADSPRLDAEVLLAHARKCRRIDLYTVFDQDPGNEIRTTFRGLVKQRAAGTPVAYLVGEREFYSIPFRVTKDVLIPRPETEMLMVALLDRAKKERNRAWKIADIGCGSGILAVCAAKHLAAAQVTAIDLSPAALAVAAENAKRHGVAERIAFVESDLFGGISDDERFDFVVSNPPYVKTAEMAELPVDVGGHEPHLALEAGPRGTEVIERLLAQAAERLTPQGWLFCELSPMIAQEVRQLASNTNLWQNVQIVPDSGGKARMLSAQRVP